MVDFLHLAGEIAQPEPEKFLNTSKHPRARCAVLAHLLCAFVLGFLRASVERIRKMRFMYSNLRNSFAALRLGFSVLERMLVTFPLLVVLLTTATFWFGGSCALWQFGLAVVGAFIIAALYRDHSWHDRITGILLFTLFLALVWLLSGSMAEMGYDNAFYRQPKTRLLMLGWNPVWQPTFEDIRIFVQTEEVHPWHVAFFPQSVEVFNATFGLFLKDSFNVTCPILFFLLPPVCATFWRFLRSLRWEKLANASAIACMVAVSSYLAWGLDNSLDVAMGIVGVGVIISMSRIFHGENEWWTLLACSLWMVSGKSLTLLTCFVLWTTFAIALLARFRKNYKRWIGRLSLCAIGLTIGLLWIGTFPYLTSWTHYGHPLYPAYTVDVERFPSRDLTWDFGIRNDDAKTMGHIGHFLNAFVSPTLTRNYYEWKTDNPGFMPACHVWGQVNRRPGGTVSPVSSATYVLFILSVIIILTLGKSARFPLLLCVIALFCIPTPYLGYLRYTPWVGVLHGLAAGIVVHQLCIHIRNRLPRFLVGFGLLFLGLSVPLLWLAAMINHRYEIEEVLRTPGIEAIVLADAKDRWGNTRLLCLQTPALQDVIILTPDAIPPEINERLRTFSLPSFQAILKPGTQPLPPLYRRITALPNKRQRYLRYPGLLLHTYGIYLPKLVWWRITGL